MGAPLPDSSLVGLPPSHSRRPPAALAPLVLLVTLLSIFLLPALSSSTPLVNSLALPETSRLVKNAVAAAASPLLRCFQVAPPVLTPTTPGSHDRVLTNGSAEDASASIPTSGGCSTTQTLMVHTFTNSYGQPFVGPYTPPSGCNFNRVTFNLTGNAAGRQFDRLGEIYFGDIEIWRTSTPEPTKDGIVWTYIKDMSHFKALLDKPQTLIFELDNTVDQTYTAPLNVVLEATFFNQPDNTVVPADQIMPISARQGSAGKASAWSVPPSRASTAVTLPRNVNKAVVGLAATGQIDEEFWYNNVPSSLNNTFPGVTLLPYSPFREVQLYIDGTLAGVVWPFPIIFTGGIVPSFWRPEVGIDAFDLREDEIDITPWLGVLCDGKSHNLEIKIAGINDDGKNHGTLSQGVGSFWIVSGQIFMWLDPEGSVTTGPAPAINAAPPVISLDSSVTKTANGTNDTLTYDVRVQRQLSITSTIKTAKNSSLPASWNQTLSYSNRGELTNKGITQYNKQSTDGTDIAGARPYARRISYPLTVNSTYTVNSGGNTTITAVIDRSQEIQVAGVPVFPTGLQSFDALPDAQNPGSGPKFQGSALQTRQNGSAFYNAPPPSQGNSSAFGSTTQVLTFRGLSIDHFSRGFPPVSGSAELYRRSVTATNGSVVSNQESLVGRQIGGASHAQEVPEVGPEDFSAQSILSALGRGPGQGGKSTPP